MSLSLRNVWTFVSKMPARAKGALAVMEQDPVGPQPIASALEEWAEKDGDRVFILFEGRRFTYAEIQCRVKKRSATLASLGLRRGDVASLVMSNAPEFMVNVWAIARLGAIASLVNTSLTGVPLAHAVMSTSPRVLIAGREHLPALSAALDQSETARAIPWVWEETRNGHGDEQAAGARELAMLDAEPNPIPPRAVTLGDDVLAYIFTSGTTGLPKAGRITYGRAHTAAIGFGGFTLGLGEGDVTYVCLPLFHSSGFLLGAGGALLSGSTMALARKLSVSRFWDDVCDSGSTSFVYIGEVCRYLVNAAPHPRERGHKLSRIVGNGMRPDVWKPFVDRFAPGIVHEFYGATEGNVNMMNLLGIEGSVGRMPPLWWLDNTFLAKFDREKEEPVRDARGLCIVCQPGEEGELLGRIDPTKVTMRFDGYLGEDSTRSKILRDVKEKGDAYFRSGDLLRRDRLGFFYFVDRIGDTFRWKGENVSTHEVQDALGRFDGVDTAVVYGVEVPGTDGRAGMAAIVLKDGCTFSPERFYEHVKKELPAYAAPVFVRLPQAASLTATFKLKKVELQADGFDPAKANDLLFFRDDRGRSYEPIDDGVYGRIIGRDLRF